MILSPSDLVFSTFSVYHFFPGIPEELMTAAAFPLSPDAGQPAPALSTPWEQPGVPAVGRAGARRAAVLA